MTSRACRITQRVRADRRRLFDFELDAEVDEVHRRLDAARLRKHRHDLANAFAAVEGAATIMVQEPLSDHDRTMLADLLTSGLSRLRGLLAAEGMVEKVALAELIISLLDEPGRPEHFSVDVTPGLVVAGSPAEIGEVVRQLLTHAGRRAPTSPLTVRATRNGDRVEVWVDDCGPQVSVRERRDIATPRRARLAQAGAITGLDVAIRLARGQGAAVMVEPRPGGGGSFGISWPAYLG